MVADDLLHLKGTTNWGKSVALPSQVSGLVRDVFERWLMSASTHCGHSSSCGRQPTVKLSQVALYRYLAPWSELGADHEDRGHWVCFRSSRRTGVDHLTVSALSAVAGPRTFSGKT